MQTILERESLASTSLQELMWEMLLRLGEDPERDGLRDTPARMERSMQYLTKGYPGESRGHSAGRYVRRGLRRDGDRQGY
jgi:GTP cyclohydrolase I